MKGWQGCLVVGVTSLALALAGCEGAIDTGASLVASTGVVDRRVTTSVAEGIKSQPKALETFTPEQEYYIGRAVAADILGRYAPYDKPALTLYVNRIGQTLAQASDRPQTYAGYHFLVLDSDEINAFAAPGGLILVSRGILRLCQSEDEIAAVLAHEIGHVQAQHGIKSIKTKRVTAALAVIGTNLAASQIGVLQLTTLTDLFQDSIQDITSTLFEKGYSRAAEGQADLAAVEILGRVGYDPYAIVRVLTTMQHHVQPSQRGFARTHPSSDDRIANVRAAIGGQTQVSLAGRTERFHTALAGI